MKQFIVFLFDKYYPSGGMNDFVGDFDRIEDAKSFIKNVEPDSWNGSDDFSRWQIYDLNNKKIVANQEYSDNYEEQIKAAESKYEEQIKAAESK